MTTQEVKRKLAAILSADVKGYSRLMGADEEGTLRTLTAYREIMAKLVRQHNGRVVNAHGDALLAEFESVVDAVKSAVEIQRELAKRNADLPTDRRMEYRMGINLGDVMVDGDSIYGDGVNIAARMESLADGGGICISGTAFDQVRNKVNLGYKYLGEQKVKNISEPVRIYRVLMEPEAAGKVVGEKKAKTKQWQMATMGLVIGVIVVVAAIVIWKLYSPSAPQPEITLKEKVVASPAEKVPTVAPPSTDVAPEEKVMLPSPKKVSKTITPAPPVDKGGPKKMGLPLPNKPSIAVLPFVNMSDDPKQEFFSDGLTEEIITALSKTPKLFVIARNSSFVYKGKPVNVQQVSQELGVKYVLEGSVRRSGDQLRITAQLIDSTTGNHLWAERYDRQIKEIFAVQDDITKNIVTTLQVQLTEGEQARVYAKGTDNLEAYLKVMEGWWHQQQSTKDGIFRSQKLAEEAIALDPNYAFAYYLLGASHYTFAWAGLSKNPQESLALGIELNRKAITLDNSLGIAYAGLGYVLIMVRQYDQAIAAGERAITLEPNSAGVLHVYGSILMFAGRDEEAIPFFKEALRLNPQPPNTYYRHYGNALANLGRYDEAIALQKKAIEQEPNDIFAYMVLASVCSMAGREAEARDAAREVLRLNPKFSVAQVDKIRPDKDRAVAKRWCDTLRQAGLPD